MQEIEIKYCETHGYTEFIKRKDGRFRCKKCAIDAVKRRKKTKELLIMYKGGECQICHYKRYKGALEFHHLNPQEKDFAISKDGYCRSIEENKREVQKCILVCSNCHKEIHAGLIDVSQVPIVNDETVFNNEKKKEDIKTHITNRPSREILESLIVTTSFKEIGRKFNVSDNAVRKWCKFYNLPYRKKDII